MDTFIELDVNPAKAVALYPSNIAGRLSIPQDEWIPLFGGPAPAKPDSTPTPASIDEKPGQEEQDQPRPPSPKGSIRASISGLRTGLDSIISSTKPRDDDTASVIGRPRGPPKGICTRVHRYICQAFLTSM